jgi:hypothetical protein
MQDPDYKSYALNLFSADRRNQFKIDAYNEVMITHYEQDALGNKISKPVSFKPLFMLHDEVDGKYYNVAHHLRQNRDAVEDEKNRAISKEAELQTQITDETTRAINAETVLRADIDAEVVRATQVDTNFSNQLAVEISDRLKGDNTLTTNLDFEVNRATAAEAVLTTGLSDEIKRASDAEYALSQDFLSYQQTNAAQHAQLSADLAGHVMTYEVRVMAVEESVSALETKHDSELKVESNARVADVANLQSQIANIISNTDPTAIDSLSEIVTAFQGDGATYVQRLDAIEATLNNLLTQAEYHDPN